MPYQLNFKQNATAWASPLAEELIISTLEQMTVFFLVAADRFYLENLGFCPLFENAFQYIPDRAIFMTIVAKGLEIRLFVYDRSDLPRLEFAYFQGAAKEELATSSCRTANMTL